MGDVIRNAIVYVDDAVRYDTAIERVASLGPTYKTVAASTHTPTSFGSLLTGLYPPENGIRSFKHTIPSNVTSIFDLDTHDVSLAAKGGMNHSISAIFRGPPRKTIEELTPPFIHVIRRPGGHAPYDAFDWDTYEYQDESAFEYLRSIARDPKMAKEDYASGVRRSVAEFERVLNVLDDRGLRDETVVVYTSDHGEMLGEYGFFGHTHLATPEVVYVPTTFVHPEMSSAEKDGLFHHVDILPTLSVLFDVDVDFGETRGQPFGDGRTLGYNHFEHVRYGNLPNVLETAVRQLGKFERTIRSIWDEKGGHVFVEGRRIPVFLVYALLLAKSPIGNQLVYNGGIIDAYRRFKPGSRSYGLPDIDREAARAEINALLRGEKQEEIRKLDRDTVERLQDMGYL